MVEVQVETPGDERGIVTAASLTSPYFGPSGTVPTNVLLEPGWVSRVRVPLGPALCPAGSGDSVATVQVRAYEGEVLADRDVTLDDAVLADINAVECRQRIATDAAAPSFSGQLDTVADALETQVVLSRGASAEPARLVSLSGNVIFSLEPAPEALPVTLESSESSATVPVTITATRCDAHAFAESKKTFVFTATYEVAGERITVEYLATGATREALQALFDACGEGSESDGIGGQ
ncbi:hypothetical protein Dac01nite_23710 [Demequina activiva]|uniref:Uncharacterized protein n=2 Tax=Demequina activiva TaxID=1582364 RepID=A0A919Q4X0_9MICO|nr:hypothetical protein Dac01nite_23710 [Demequina activiva]